MRMADYGNATRYSLYCIPSDMKSRQKYTRARRMNNAEKAYMKKREGRRALARQKNASPPDAGDGLKALSAASC